MTHACEDRIGDVRLLQTCLQLFFRNLQQLGCSALELELHAVAEHGNLIPTLTVRLGSGCFPREFALHDALALDFDAFNAVWTQASSGGKIVREEAAWHLRLNGMRMPPEPIALSGQMAAALGKGDDLHRIDEALALLLPVERSCARQSSTSVRGSLGAHKDALKQSAVSIDFAWDPAAPQLVLHRRRLRMAFEVLID